MEFLWDTATSWYKPSTTLSGDLSIAKKNNGNIICILSQAGIFYEGECTLDDLLSKNDSITTWSPISIPLCRNGCTISRVGNKLYLCINDRGNNDGTAPAFVKLYISPSGNGGDWEYYSTIQETYFNISRDENSFGIPYSMTGCIAVLPNGRWLITAGNYRAQYNNQMQMQCIYTSDDNGITWIVRLDMAHGPVGGYYFGQKIPQNVCVLDNGDLFCANGFDYAGYTYKLYKSTNNGDNWDIVVTQDTKDWFGYLYASNFAIYTINNTIYSLAAKYGYRDNLVFKISNPSSEPSIKEVVKILPVLSFETKNDTVSSIQNIDNKLVIIYSNYILGVATKVEYRGVLKYKTSEGIWKRVIRCR